MIKILSCILLFTVSSYCQVINWSPAYPSISDTITITYNSSLGNSELIDTDEIYIHTGVLNKYSSSNHDWMNIPVQWHEGADTLIQMSNLGNNIYEISFKISSFFNVSNIDKNEFIALIFRNEDGSLSGKNNNNTNFYIPLMEQDEFSKFVSPVDFPLLVQPNEEIPINVIARENALINLFINDNLVSQQYNDSLEFIFSTNEIGKHYIHYNIQSAGNIYTDSIYFIVESPQVFEELPESINNGINVINDSSIILVLEAPYKQFAYVIGDWTDWAIDPNYKMKKTNDGNKYWIEINDLDPNVEYRFQYFVDAKIKIADPYSTKIISSYDKFIPNSVYPDLITYPENMTHHAVSVVKTQQDEYVWESNDFQKPDSRDLVIYELLIRDFSYRSDYQTVIDSLEYLKRLGINAIELMPVIEYDGLLSWGYAPTFFFAAEKFYGPENTLKALVDSCHKNGIAVIMDIVLNHAFRPNPWLRLYYDIGKDEPTFESPWFNIVPTHPFNVGYDFNHSSSYVQAFADSVLDFWTTNFRFDGYRFDLSKGLTQFNSLGDVGLWSNYDLERVNNIKRITNNLWNKHPGTIVILEHFANNDEEMELASHGCLLWGKAHTEYNQSTMGYVGGQNDDFEYGVSHLERGWQFHNLIGFMESHDEERLMYNNLNYGNQSGDYDIQNLNISLERMSQAAAFFFTIPGPKMIWQFGELGYDYSINFPSNTEESRTSPKPVKWDYYYDFHRRQLYLEYAALIHLKTSYPAFRTNQYRLETWGTQKQIYIDDDAMKATIIGNFNIYNDNVYTGFQHDGWWYDYMSGDSLYVENTDMTINLDPGNWKIFTDVKLTLPDLNNPIDTTEIIASSYYDYEESANKLNIYPNPFKNVLNVSFETDKNTRCNLSLYNHLGELVFNKDLINNQSNVISYKLNLKENGLSIKDGFYICEIETPSSVHRKKIIYIK